MPSVNQQTYNDQQLHEVASRVFHKSMTKIEKLLDSPTSGVVEWEEMTALAACADAAASQIMSDDDYDGGGE